MVCGSSIRPLALLAKLLIMAPVFAAMAVSTCFTSCVVLPPLPLLLLLLANADRLDRACAPAAMTLMSPAPDSWPTSKEVRASVTLKLLGGSLMETADSSQAYRAADKHAGLLVGVGAARCTEQMIADAGHTDKGAVIGYLP
jgi:hypothetical protein